MDFVAASYTHAGFLLIIGIIFLYAAAKYMNTTPKEKKFSPAKALSIFGFMNIALAHIALIVALGNGLSDTYRSPCENVISTTETTGNTTTYTYTDSCDGIDAPKGNERLYTINLYAMYLEAIIFGVALFIYGMAGVIRWVRKW